MRKEKVKTICHMFFSFAVDVLAGYLCLVGICFFVYLCCSKELTTILEEAMKEQSFFTSEMKFFLFYVSLYIYTIYYFVHTLFLGTRSFRKRSKLVGEETLCRK